MISYVVVVVCGMGKFCVVGVGGFRIDYCNKVINVVGC